MPDSTESSLSMIRLACRPDSVSPVQWEIKIRDILLSQGPFEYEQVGYDPHRLEFAVKGVDEPQGSACRVVLRGKHFGENRCTCLPFRAGTLGTCEHIESVLDSLRSEFGDGVDNAFRNKPFSEIHLSYGARRTLRFRAAPDCDESILQLVRQCFDENDELIDGRIPRLPALIDRANELRHELVFRSDAVEFLARLWHHSDLRQRIERILPQGIHSPRFDNLLKTPIPMFQRESMLAAASEGRFILGDAVGLGHIKQALGAVELMVDAVGIQRVLVLTEPSRLFVWERDIKAQTQRGAAVVHSSSSNVLAAAIPSETFYRILSHEDAAEKIQTIESGFRPDLIIFDDAHSLRKLDSDSLRNVKRLESDYLFVLVGSDPAQRPGPFLSFVDMVDRFRFGLLGEFLNRHRIFEDEKKTTMKFVDMENVAETLASNYIRRRPDEVRQFLPPYIDQYRFVIPTDEFRKEHDRWKEELLQILARCGSKRDCPRHLLSASQELVEKLLRICGGRELELPENRENGEPDEKVAEILRILSDAFESREKRSIVFARYPEFLEKIGEELAKYEVDFVRLTRRDTPKEQIASIRRFEEESDCRFLLVSDDVLARKIRFRGVGMIVHADRPWNPDRIRQRLAATTQSPKGPIHVHHVLWHGSFEEELLDYADRIDPRLPVDLEENESVVFLDDFGAKQFLKQLEELFPGGK